MAPAGAVHSVVGPGSGPASAGADPAEIGEIGVRPAARRQEHDGRALLVDGLVIVVEPDVVDTAAGQIDRAGDSRRLDQHALGLRERLGAGLHRLLHRRRGWRRAGRRGRRAGCAAGAAGRLIGGRRRLLLLRFGRLLLGDLLLLARLFDLRPGNEELPAEQHDHRQHDRHDEIAVIVGH